MAPASFTATSFPPPALTKHNAYRFCACKLPAFCHRRILPPPYLKHFCATTAGKYYSCLAACLAKRTLCEGVPVSDLLAWLRKQGKTLNEEEIAAILKLCMMGLSTINVIYEEAKWN
ncbi:hypothetical protein NPIL_9891 [Nephila pilipes]|uniref:Uncharacterized protein n=1 Tax=Nephila pilipes TaxID=299642 RepID=A0A8X6JPV6_NEPPI|nr:hypothetical protein NPIL_9891 [Nephila pilipes]